MIAAARAVEVASVSEPASAGSEINILRSTPMAMVSISARSDASGPMEIVSHGPPGHFPQMQRHLQGRPVKGI